MNEERMHQIVSSLLKEAIKNPNVLAAKKRRPLKTEGDWKETKGWWYPDGVRPAGMPSKGSGILYRNVKNKKVRIYMGKKYVEYESEGQMKKVWRKVNRMIW